MKTTTGPSKKKQGQVSIQNLALGALLLSGAALVARYGGSMTSWNTKQIPLSALNDHTGEIPLSGAEIPLSVAEIPSFVAEIPLFVAEIPPFVAEIPPSIYDERYANLTQFCLDSQTKETQISVNKTTADPAFGPVTQEGQSCEKPTLPEDPLVTDSFFNTAPLTRTHAGSEAEFQVGKAVAVIAVLAILYVIAKKVHQVVTSVLFNMSQILSSILTLNSMKRGTSRQGVIILQETSAQSYNQEEPIIVDDRTGEGKISFFLVSYLSKTNPNIPSETLIQQIKTRESANLTNQTEVQQTLLKTPQQEDLRMMSHDHNKMSLPLSSLPSVFSPHEENANVDMALKLFEPHRIPLSLQSREDDKRVGLELNESSKPALSPAFIAPVTVQTTTSSNLSETVSLHSAGPPNLQSRSNNESTVLQQMALRIQVGIALKNILGITESRPDGVKVIIDSKQQLSFRCDNELIAHAIVKQLEEKHNITVTPKLTDDDSKSANIPDTSKPAQEQTLTLSQENSIIVLGVTPNVNNPPDFEQLSRSINQIYSTPKIDSEFIINTPLDDQKIAHNKAKTYLSDNLKLIGGTFEAVALIRQADPFPSVQNVTVKKGQLSEDVVSWESICSVPDSIQKDSLNVNMPFSIYQVASKYHGYESDYRGILCPGHAAKYFTQKSHQNQLAQLAFGDQQIELINCAGNLGMNALVNILDQNFKMQFSGGNCRPTSFLTITDSDNNARKMIEKIKQCYEHLEYSYIENTPLNGTNPVAQFLTVATDYLWLSATQASLEVQNELEFVFAYCGYRAALQQAIAIATKKKQSVVLKAMPIGLGVFGNDPTNIAKAFYSAISTCQDELRRNQVTVKLQVYDDREKISKEAQIMAESLGLKNDNTKTYKQVYPNIETEWERMGSLASSTSLDCAIL